MNPIKEQLEQNLICMEFVEGNEPSIVSIIFNISSVLFDKENPMDFSKASIFSRRCIFGKLENQGFYKHSKNHHYKIFVSFNTNN